ncbi:MAG TPA: type II secretion system protein GspC [Myxococcota bacterium]|nr:type II secretion system protein GspC [Myxococcota bacterium]
MREILTSKRVWGGAAVLAVLAFLLAFSGNKVLGKYLELPEDAVLPTLAGIAAGPSDAGSASGRSFGPRPVSSYSRAILERNIFDSTKLDVDVDEDVGGQTDLRVVLLATLVAEPEVYSSALIAEDGRDAHALGYGLGDWLLDEAEIIGIEQKQVKLRRKDGEIEYLAMEEEAPKRSTRPSKKTDSDEEDGITKDGEKIIVERSVVDDAMNNIDSLASKIRVVPHKGSDGEIDGYRLSAIRRGSLFDKLGIKNGDVVHAVNGMALTSTDGAFSAYQTLQNESSFSFDVTRRNQRSTFEYEIR